MSYEICNMHFQAITLFWELYTCIFLLIHKTLQFVIIIVLQMSKLNFKKLSKLTNKKLIVPSKWNNGCSVCVSLSPEFTLFPLWQNSPGIRQKHLS